MLLYLHIQKEVVRMIQKLAFFLASVFLGVLCASAVQAETIRGEGRYVSQELTTLTPFHAIEVHGDIKVSVRQMPTQSVTLSGPANLATLADIRVEDHTLKVDYKRPLHVRGEQTLQVSVFVPEIASLTVKNKGSIAILGEFKAADLVLNAMDEGSIEADMLHANQVRIQAMNKAEVDLEHLKAKHVEAAAFHKADIELSGSAEKAVLTNNGSGDIDAKDFRVNDMHAKNHASGDIEVFAMKNLHAAAHGHGLIEYHGAPVITREGNAKKIRAAFDD